MFIGFAASSLSVTKKEEFHEKKGEGQRGS
jgi:hypothetical protein